MVARPGKTTMSGIQRRICLGTVKAWYTNGDDKHVDQLRMTFGTHVLLVDFDWSPLLQERLK